MRTTIMSLGATILLVAGTLRLRAQIRAPHPGAGYLGSAGLAAGLALLLHAPAVYQWSDRVVFRTPNASALTSYLLTVVGIGAALEMVTGLVTTARVTTRWARRTASAIVAGAMIVAFTFAVPLPEQPLFFEHYRNDPSLTVFWVLFCGSSAAAMGWIAFLVRGVVRYDDRQVSRGLRLISVGAGCVAVFLLGCLVQVALPDIPPLAETFGEGVLLTGGLLLATGMLWPQFATKVQRATACRRLRPLWGAVTARYPYVRSRATRPSLYRTVIEIEDALAEARAHRQIDTPLLRALDALTAHSAEQFDATVNDLLRLAACINRSRLVTVQTGTSGRSTNG